MRIRLETLERYLKEAKKRDNQPLLQLLEAIKSELDEKAENLIKEAREEAQKEAQREIQEADQAIKKEVRHYSVSPNPSKTLAIHCGDPRFQEAFCRFLHDKAGPEQSYDLIVFPGSTQILTFGESLPKFTNSLLRPIKFLVKEHSLKRIIVIMHEDCGWYKSFVPQFTTIHEKTLRERQIKDLLAARKLLQDLFPEVKIEMHYAAIGSEGQVEFSMVT